MDAIARLLHPRSVAIVGASGDSNKTTGRPMVYLKKYGFGGRIYPVNPGYQQLMGLDCYPDVKSLPEVPDVALVLLGARRVQSAVQELADRGTAAAIVVAGGYMEIGVEGTKRQDELREAAGNMRLLGPNTIGLINLTDHIALSVSGALELDQFPSGNIALVSQSGGVLSALLSRAVARGIGLSKLIATGNEADLDLADFVDHLADDPDTDVIALYIEGLRNPGKFRAAALKSARAGKTIVAYKIGKSESGARSAISHTGALTGEDRMYDAFFDQLGVIRAPRYADLLGIPAAFQASRSLHGKRVAILTSTGGAGTLVADSLGLDEFIIPPPDAKTAIRLRELQPGDDAVFDRNPIDVTLAGLKPDLLRAVIKALLDSPEYDAIIVIVGSSGLAMPELMAGAIQDCLPSSEKPILAFVSPHAPSIEGVLNQRGVPAYSAPEDCSTALTALLQRSRWRQSPLTMPSKPIASLSVDPASEFPNGSLDEAQAKQLMSRFGITTVREEVVESAEQAEKAARGLSGKVALKILASDITHKSDIGGVAINLAPEQVGARLVSMTHDLETRTSWTPKRFLIQEMVPGGVELLLGMRRDSLGTAIVVGAGGFATELFDDTAVCMLPEVGGLHREPAMNLARSLKIWPLLVGFRGRPPADVDALVSAIVAFSQMTAHYKDRLIEAEINPIFVLPQGQGVLAVDAVVVFGS